MKVSLNPFNEVFETKASPHAFTLRSSFRSKLEQAGRIFGGVFDYGKDQEFCGHFGIFDLCTLGISFIVFLGCEWCKQHQNPLVKYGLGFFIGLLNIIFRIARVLTALVFSLNPLTLMITGIVHLIANHVAGGKELKEAALMLQISDERGCQFALRDELDRKITEKDVTAVDDVEPLERFAVEVPKADDEGTDKLSILEIKRLVLKMEKTSNSTGGSETKQRLTGVGDKSYRLPVLSQGNKETLNTEAYKGLRELVILNAGGVTALLEDTDEGRQILSAIMA